MPSVPLVSVFTRATPRKRLWLAGGALAMFLLTLLIGNQCVATDKSVTRQMLGHDFLAFYTAGSFVYQGRTADLYDLGAVQHFEQSTATTAGLEVGKSFGPWWNPPFYALLFEPLALLSYDEALDAWRAISVISAALAIAMLCGIILRSSLSTTWQQWLLPALLIVISFPFIQAMGHGQNTFTSLLLLCGTVTLWRSRRGFTAGCVCGLLFYKPQLAAVVAGVLALDLGWPALAGVSLVGCSLLIVNLITLPATLGAWLHQLPANVHWIQVENAYLWERHVTLKSFWRLLLQGRGAGEPLLITTALTWISQLALGALLMRATLAGRKHCPNLQLRRDRLIAATIVAMPLLMPFYFDYDLLLLAISAVLYAAERISHPEHTLPQDRWLTARWVLLYAWLFVNPSVAFHTHISGSVLLLCSIAMTSIHRINRADGEETPLLIIHPQRVAMAA